MDKGKRPLIEDEEEDFFSVLNGLHEEMISGSADETPLVGDMNSMDEELFSKFLTMNFNDNSSNMEASSKAATSASEALPVAQPPRNLRLPRLPRPKLSLKINQRHSGDASITQPRIVRTKSFVVRKAMPRDELEMLALHDPKRANRIMTNRMSAIRSKEKKKLYIYMLENKLSALQSKSTEVTSELKKLEAESESLNAENKMLTTRMELAQQQVNLQDALNDQIKSQILHTKALLLRQKNAPNYGGPVANPYPGNINPAMMNAPLAAQQFPRLQLHHPHQQQQQNFDFQQPNLGQLNYGVQYGPGEPSQPQPERLQQQQVNPQPSFIEQVLAAEKSIYK
ncbi:probable transcription factor PosF21 [Mangifera indica]|uniref:probable transcription factor PosF21 n=1 Tax=Mangifera indica TaxID=29780 RepID=UPI001CFBBE65|nr:probable transcription factor PosF21 [Mangifera indica]